jgi:hypothetical protein
MIINFIIIKIFDFTPVNGVIKNKDLMDYS